MAAAAIQSVCSASADSWNLSQDNLSVAKHLGGLHPAGPRRSDGMRCLGVSADFWLNLQVRWDLHRAQVTEAEALASIDDFHHLQKMA